ncbi:MAG: hypothetical protein H6Q31_1836 [Bacteroidetes bacterium]|nr:hypothetical protein [Bacteroidota bacterium]
MSINRSNRWDHLRNSQSARGDSHPPSRRRRDKLAENPGPLGPEPNALAGLRISCYNSAAFSQHSDTIVGQLLAVLLAVDFTAENGTPPTLTVGPSETFAECQGHSQDLFAEGFGFTLLWEYSTIASQLSMCRIYNT